MPGWTSATIFRWVDVSFALPTSLFRWPRLFASYLTPLEGWSSTIGSLTLSTRWAPRIRIPDIDDVVWSVVSAVESVALVGFLCIFFVFCGCTL